MGDRQPVRRLARTAAYRIAVRAQPMDDQLIGKTRCEAHRKAGFLNVYDAHENVPFSPDVAEVVEGEIDAFADWLGFTVARASH